MRLDGARIRLITDEKGRDNWADLGKSETAQTKPEDTGATEVPTIASLEISDAAVVMENRQEKSRREVRDFNLKTGRLASGEPFDFATDFVLDQDRSLSAKVKVAAKVTADLEHNVASPRRAEDRRHDLGPGLSGRRRAGRGAREIARSRCRARAVLGSMA